MIFEISEVIPSLKHDLIQFKKHHILAMPYFDSIEAQQLKACVVDATNNRTLETVFEDTLKERLERRMKKRTESGDFRVCAAHDLAPILEKAFDIKATNLQTDTEFLTILDQSQLKL
jgi:hypothetical protein